MPETARTWAEMREKAHISNMLRSPRKQNMVNWTREVVHPNIENALFTERQAANALRVSKLAGPQREFTPNNLAFLKQTANFSRSRKQTNLERSFTELKAAERGKKKRSKRTRRNNKRI